MLARDTSTSLLKLETLSFISSLMELRSAYFPVSDKLKGGFDSIWPQVPTLLNALKLEVSLDKGNGVTSNKIPSKGPKL
jgi:hypothetical protein